MGGSGNPKPASERQLYQSLGQEFVLGRISSTYHHCVGNPVLGRSSQFFEIVLKMGADDVLPLGSNSLQPRTGREPMCVARCSLRRSELCQEFCGLCCFARGHLLTPHACMYCLADEGENDRALVGNTYLTQSLVHVCGSRRYSAQDSVGASAPGSRSRWKRLVCGRLPFGFKTWPDGRDAKLRLHMTSTTARQAVGVSLSSSQGRELSPDSVPLAVEGAEAPVLVGSISSTDEVRARNICQEGAEAFLDTDELDVTSLLATKLPPSSLAQGIVAWLGSDSYDNIVDMLVEKTGPFEDQMSNFIEGL